MATDSAHSDKPASDRNSDSNVHQNPKKRYEDLEMNDDLMNQALPRRQVFLRLLGYLLPYKGAILLVILGFVINAGTEIAIAKLMQFIIDAINAGDQSQQNWFPVLIVVLFVCRGLGSFLGNYFSAWVSRNLVYRLRVLVFDKLLRLPTSFYLANSAGAISSKLIFDVEQVTAASTDSLKTILRDGLTVLGLVGFLLYLNWRLSLILFVVLPAVLWLIRLASKKFLSLSRGIQESMGQISHIANEVIGGFSVVKNYGGQAYEKRRFDEASRDNLKRGMQMVVTNSINTPMIQLLMASAMSVVVWLALRPSVMSGISAGEFVAYITAAGLLSKPVRSLTDVNQNLQRGIAAGQSIFALLDRADERDTGSQMPDLQGKIEFCQVDLTYEDGTKALQDFSLSIQAGETIAIVGRSGAGKTSLVNLLTRALEPSKGQILLDGIAIDAIKLDSLRAQIAMVNQQVILFNDTVKHNIAYGSLADKSEAQIHHAAKMAFADDFIQKLPHGYDSEIGAEGLQLSGGQRQRLSIARALLKDAPILILDEATSALDNESEFFIQKALDNIMQNRTTLVIAHRLTTIENADRIVVMNQGKIVEIGTHAELLAKQGDYAIMYQRNFEF